MNNPEYVKVDGEIYKINTDFRVALECNKIAENTEIGDYERALAIIYKLFGEKGLDCQNQNKLLELGMQYLSLGMTEKELNSNPSDNELDFNKCEGLIKSSFKFDYGYDPYEQGYIHWWTFYNDLENMSSSEFGTCCALNRVAGILMMDTKGLKDKEREKILNAQKEIRKKYCKSKKQEMSDKEKENVANLYKKLNLWKGE